MFNCIIDSIINDVSEDEIKITIEKLTITVLTIIMIKRLKKNEIIKQYKIIMNSKCRLRYEVFESKFEFSKIKQV